MSFSWVFPLIRSLELPNNTIEAKIQKLQLMGTRLSYLKSQDNLSLLRHSFVTPRVFFIYQTAPYFLYNQLEVFVGLLCSLLSTILNVNPDVYTTWFPASVPVHAGGLAAHRAAQLTASAYLASGVGCFSLVLQILPSRSTACNIPYIQAAITHSSQSCSKSAPSLPESVHQWVWEALL